jgi:amino acid transporter
MRMHRSIGLVGLTFMAVSGIIGSGWMFAPLLAVQHAGPAALVAWLVGGIAMFFIAITFAETSAMLPVPGGIARVPQFSHGNVVALAMGWTAWVGYNTAAPIEVEAMLRYLDPQSGWLFTAPGSGNLSWGGTAVAAGLLVLFTIINALGVRFLTYVNTTVTWLKLAIPLVIVVTLIASRFETANFTAGGSFAPFGLQGVLAAISSGGVIFCYIGFRHAVDMAGEAHNPGFTVPMALMLSILICFGVYGGIQIAFIGALEPGATAGGWAHLVLPGDTGPLGAVASALGLLWLVSLLNAGAVIGPFGGALVYVGSNARIAYALAEDGLFPRIIGTLSRQGVPLAGMILNLVVSTLVFIALPFTELVQLNSSAIVLSFVVGPIAVVALRSLMPDRRRPFRLPAVHVIAATAFVISTLVVYWSGWDTIVRLGVCLAVGVVVLVALALRADRPPLDFAEAAWLIPYLLGIGVISYFGAFGGTGAITFGWDILVITVFSVAMFTLAVRSRLSPQKADAYLREEHRLELDNLDRTAV